jgi:hypothetical protein
VSTKVVARLEILYCFCSLEAETQCRRRVLGKGWAYYIETPSLRSEGAQLARERKAGNKVKEKKVVQENDHPGGERPDKKKGNVPKPRRSR